MKKSSVMTSRRARLSIVRMGALLGAFAVVACSHDQTLRAPAIGAPAPTFTAHDYSDTPVSLASLRGKIVVLNEWATWCTPCREELPQLEALHKQFASKGVEFIGVSVDAAGTGADVRDFAQEHGMTYAIWLDPEKQFALKFLTVGVPETFIIDGTGVIRWRKIGALPPGDTTLATALRGILGV
jgi:cytochrome c biogenesis protein CcmG, thiol:disulfide interchange protein DsbE